MTMLRPAGLNERRCIARDSLSLYGSIITVGTYVHMTGHATLSQDDIFRALKYCIARHAVLSTIVQNSDTESPQLVRASRIDLRNHIVFKETSDLRSFLEQAHSDPLADYESRPQWRIYVAPQGRHLCIAFASSHALCDGASGLAFHRAFLEGLDGLHDSTEDLEPVYVPEKVPELLPPLEKVADFEISWAFLLGPLIKEFCPRWLGLILGISLDRTNSSDIARPWTGAASRPERTMPAKLPQTSVEYVSIPSEVLVPVLAQCRGRGARLTGLLNHLATHSLVKALDSQGQKYHSFLVETALDLRRCLPRAQGQIANFASVSMETIEIDSKDAEINWSAIRNTTEQLSAASQTLSDQPIALLKYLSKFREWTLKKATSPAEGAFGMSNIGTFDSESSKSDEWSIAEIVFSQSADATNAPFNVNAASAKGGSVWIVLSWWVGMLGVEDERRLMREVCDRVRKELDEIAQA